MRFDPKPYERLLLRFLAAQSVSIEEVITEVITSAVLSTLRVNPPEDEPFSFRQYPALSRVIDGLLTSLTEKLTGLINVGTEWAWDLSNMKNDDMLNGIIDSIGRERIPEERLAKWQQKNLPALLAFQKRKINGMGLSDRIWAFVKGIKGDLELAIDLGLGEGQSADRLSRAVRQYLREPDRLYRRVRGKDGVLRLSRAASNYHPGQGVYRSSYKNAHRLAATETNMAYRTSDHDRVQNMDFVLGIEVHLSNNHTCLNAKGVPEPFYDICDELKGKYPKWFKFVGWHPQCRCYTTTILPTQDEMIEYMASMDENGHSDYKFKGYVTDVPDNFKKWVIENQNRIALAEERGTLPYFIRDNYNTVAGIISDAGNYYAPVSDADIDYLVKNGIISKDSVPILKSYTSDQSRQHILSVLNDSRAAFDVETYAKLYGKKNPEIAELASEIGILKGRDEVLRLKKINHLKNLCGELSAKEVQKWGFAKGLTYDGVQRGVVISTSKTYTINGKKVKVEEMVKDLILFRSEDTSVRFAYPLGVRKSGVAYDIHDAAQLVTSTMPSYLQRGIDTIKYLDTRNPYDKYWRAMFKDPTHTAYGSDGKDITFWKSVKENPSFMEQAMMHEAAHIFDSRHKITDSPEWREAVKADIELYKTNKIAQSFPTGYARQAYEAASNVSEDFAESVALKVLYDKKYGSTWFSRLFPNRAKALEDILGKWPKG